MSAVVKLFFAKGGPRCIVVTGVRAVILTRQEKRVIFSLIEYVEDICMQKTRHIVMVISWLLGYLGADRFYLGEIVWGIIKLVTIGGLGVWWLVDALYYTYKAGETARASS